VIVVKKKQDGMKRPNQRIHFKKRKGLKECVKVKKQTKGLVATGRARGDPGDIEGEIVIRSVRGGSRRRNIS
jgi:hypothetical protein